MLAARNSEHIGEAFAAYGSFATAEFFYRNAFNLRLKNQGNAHAKTIQTAWRVIELTQMAGVKFTSEEREDIILDTNVKMDNEPAASIAPEGSKLNSMFVSPRQGQLVFTVSEPVLRGQRQYEDSFCDSENVPPYERRFDWKTAASVLAPGGGDVGAAYTAEVARDYLSYSTGDLAAVLADGGDVAQALYGDDRDPKSFRVLALRTEAVRMLTSIHVLGGYQLGDTVVLDTVGQTESGWIVRGPVILTRNSKGKFIRSGDRTVSYPE